jgi:hypothetical protein
LRNRSEETGRLGAELVVVGNGAPPFARAFREDFAQGDPWQLGGVLVIRPGGELTYRQASREAGDHPPVEEILAALAPGARAVDEAAPRGRLPGAVASALGRGLSLLVDPMIALSFDRTGFRVHALAFRPEDLEVDLGGRRAVLSGANSGIGFETSLALADLGAELVLLCRSAQRGEQAAGAIREATGSRRVRAEVCDVSSLASVRAAAAKLGDGPVDALVHNAGGRGEPATTTAHSPTPRPSAPRWCSPSSGPSGSATRGSP